MKSLLIACLLAVPALAAETPPPLNDAQIATIALTAHQIDSTRGKDAVKKSQNAEVKQFAEAMVKDHEAGAQEVLALAKKLGVKPQKSAVSQDLEKGAKDTQAALNKKTGAAYDAAYIDAEVGYHEAVISAVEKVLLPAVKNAEVKTALEQTLPTLQGHLQHAKNVRKLVSGTGGAGGKP